MDSIFNALEKILEERKSSSADQSYVYSLYNSGSQAILNKISEESEEVIKAANEESREEIIHEVADLWFCLLYTSPSPRDRTRSRMPSSA